MAIEVVSLEINEATLSGSVQARNGIAYLAGESGTVQYTHIQPEKLTNFKAAEFFNLANSADGSIRLRFGNGINQFWLDDSDMTFKQVSDVSSWSSEYTLPWLLGNLDLWTRPTLQPIVHLAKTPTNQNPMISVLRVLMVQPTWEGAIASCIRSVAKKLKVSPFVLLHQETISQATSSWKIGKPYTEHQYETTALLQVTVDGVHKSASLNNGEITLMGPPAPVGSEVELAVYVQPPVSVRRSDETLVVHRTPAWFMTGLVISGGLQGTTSSLFIGGNEVFVKEQELRITVNGIGHRQADALAMRLALQSAFAEGLTITFPSGRCVFGQLDGLVELLEGDSVSLPMASGVVMIVVREYVHASVFRNQRDSSGNPITTEITVNFPVESNNDETVPAQTFTAEDYSSCSS
jgi:hypothetical protein